MQNTHDGAPKAFVMEQHAHGTRAHRCLFELGLALDANQCIKQGLSLSTALLLICLRPIALLLIFLFLHIVNH